MSVRRNELIPLGDYFVCCFGAVSPSVSLLDVVLEPRGVQLIHLQLINSNAFMPLVSRLVSLSLSSLVSSLSLSLSLSQRERERER